MPFALNIKCYSSNNNQKKEAKNKKLKIKQQEFLNKGDRSKQSCAKMLIKFPAKILSTIKRKKKEKKKKTTGSLK